MKYYQIIKTDKKYNENKIACHYNPKFFTGNISLDDKTPIKNNPFITFYYVKNTYNLNYMEDENKSIIILLKEDIKNIYTSNDEGNILKDDFVNNIYTCNNEKLEKIVNKIGNIIIKDNYYANGPFYRPFHREIRLKDNQMVIKSHHNFNIDILKGNIIENNIDKHLEINYDNISININKYTKENLIDIEKLLFHTLIITEIQNINNENNLKFSIKEFINILQKEFGKINAIYSINEEYKYSEISGLFGGVTLLIKTEDKLVIISKGICD